MKYYILMIQFQISEKLSTLKLQKLIIRSMSDKAALFVIKQIFNIKVFKFTQVDIWQSDTFDGELDYIKTLYNVKFTEGVMSHE